jgi:hypothetical protein
MVQARLELIKRNLDREAYSGRAQLLDVGLHDVVTPRISGFWPSGCYVPGAGLGGPATRHQFPVPLSGRMGSFCRRAVNGEIANGYGRQV